MLLFCRQKLYKVEVHGGFARDVDKGRKIVVCDFVNGDHEHALRVSLLREVWGERDPPVCVSARRALVGLSQVEVLGVEVKHDHKHVVVYELEKQALIVETPTGTTLRSQESYCSSSAVTAKKHCRKVEA